MVKGVAHSQSKLLWGGFCCLLALVALATYWINSSGGFLAGTKFCAYRDATTSAPTTRVVRDLYADKPLSRFVLSDTDRQLDALVNNTQPHCWHRPRLLIFSQQRSGTHWLLQLLNSHPEVHIGPEVLKSYTQNGGKGLLRRLISSLKSRRNGFILQFDSMIHRTPFALELFANKKFDMVHLVRKNSLDMVVSRMVPLQTGIVHCHVDEDCAVLKNSTVTLDVKTLLPEIEILEKQKELARAYLENSGARWVEMSYDELVSDELNYMCKLFNFIGCTCPPAVESGYVKGIVKHRKEVIRNWDEVSRLLQDTIYEQYLYL